MRVMNSSTFRINGKFKVKLSTGFFKKGPQTIEDAKRKVQSRYADLKIKVSNNFTLVCLVSYIVERNIEENFSNGVIVLLRYP